jgi:trimethylamine--corrinoid protein Co-methyltransferase
VSDETLALDLIQEVGWQGHYLDREHTARHHRREHLRPRLLRRDPRELWERKGSKTALDLARERMHSILERHQPPPLDPAVEKELRAYVARVAKRTVADFEAAEWEE